MVVGQSVNVKVIAIIQARLTSSRLPGKVLLPLPVIGGSPLIYNVINKLKKSRFISKIIVATSNSNEQQRLIEFLNEIEQPYFAGDEFNVLSRFREIIIKEKPDVVVRITSDNPFIDIPILDEVIEKQLNSNFDYTNTTGLPYGMNLEVFNGNSFVEMSSRKDLSNDDREHVTFKFKNCKDYKAQSIKPLNEKDYSNIRVTVDTREDYMRAALLYSNSDYSNQQISDLDYVVSFYEKYPYLFE